tara:strand:+ start:95 stop:1822 length:1728 start_codon:yes stop_codon:yes gene_type:complete
MNTSSDNLDEGIIDNYKNLRKVGKEVEDMTKPLRNQASKSLSNVVKNLTKGNKKNTNIVKQSDVSKKAAEFTKDYNKTKEVKVPKPKVTRITPAMKEKAFKQSFGKPTGADWKTGKGTYTPPKNIPNRNLYVDKTGKPTEKGIDKYITNRNTKGKFKGADIKPETVSKGLEKTAKDIKNPTIRKSTATQIQTKYGGRRANRSPDPWKGASSVPKSDGRKLNNPMVNKNTKVPSTGTLRSTTKNPQGMPKDILKQIEGEGWTKKGETNKFWQGTGEKPKEVKVPKPKDFKGSKPPGKVKWDGPTYTVGGKSTGSKITTRLRVVKDTVKDTSKPKQLSFNIKGARPSTSPPELPKFTNTSNPSFRRAKPKSAIGSALTKIASKRKEQKLLKPSTSSSAIVKIGDIEKLAKTDKTTGGKLVTKNLSGVVAGTKTPSAYKPPDRTPLKMPRKGKLTGSSWVTRGAGRYLGAASGLATYKTKFDQERAKGKSRVSSAVAGGLKGSSNAFGTYAGTVIGRKLGGAAGAGVGAMIGGKVGNRAYEIGKNVTNWGKKTFKQFRGTKSTPSKPVRIPSSGSLSS